MEKIFNVILYLSIVTLYTMVICYLCDIEQAWIKAVVFLMILDDEFLISIAKDVDNNA